VVVGKRGSSIIFKEGVEHNSKKMVGFQAGKNSKKGSSRISSRIELGELGAYRRWEGKVCMKKAWGGEQARVQNKAFQ